MTRVNLLDPTVLKQKTLIAEYRELPRIFGYVRAAIKRGESPLDKRNPSRYTLGTGHCRFFYPRLGWLVSRQKAVVSECLRRGYNIQHTDVDSLVVGIPDEWMGNWEPSDGEVMVNRARVFERGGIKE